MNTTEYNSVFKTENLSHPNSTEYQSLHFLPKRVIHT